MCITQTEMLGREEREVQRKKKKKLEGLENKRNKMERTVRIVCSFTTKIKTRMLNQITVSR